MEQTTKNNALEFVSDYIIPTGMIDFNNPANMIKEYMQKVMENPENVEYRQVLESLTSGAKVIVDAGRAQTEQGNMMIRLIEINRNLKLI